MGKTNLKAGRTWDVDSRGVSSLERNYVVVLDQLTAADGETSTFPGVPAIGSKHPLIDSLEVTGYRVVEGASADKNTIAVAVKYGYKETQVESGGTPEEPVEIEYQVDEWGWDASTDERELTMSVDGKAVTNSASDPFDRVPTVSVPAPIFTKVFKTKKRLGDAMSYNCKVNDAKMTIGSIECDIGTLLCSVAEKRLIGDKNWLYQYTVQLKLKSNKVIIEQTPYNGVDPTEIGWDVAIADTGMRAKNRDRGDSIELIRMTDKETGKMCTVTSPALLDGHGYLLQTGYDPYLFRFMAYARTKFPDIFYSEPAAVLPTED